MRRTILLLAVLFPLAVPAHADQNDPRLPDLFAALKASPGEDAARPIAAKIWEIWDEDPQVPDVEHFMLLGRTLLSSGQLPEALEQFDVVTRIAPDFAEGWNKRATVQFFLGRLEESRADVARTLKLEPRHFGALAGLGMIELTEEHPAQALAAFEAALAVHPWIPERRFLDDLREKVKGKPL